jgi:hypothetical protein
MQGSAKEEMGACGDKNLIGRETEQKYQGFRHVFEYVENRVRSLLRQPTSDYYSY